LNQSIEFGWFLQRHQHRASSRKLREETLIVKGLSSKLTAEAIKTAFSAYGQVNNVKIMDQYVAGQSWSVLFFSVSSKLGD
jgi:RNA recognition motif-containing protein